MSVGHRFYYFAYGSNLSTPRLRRRAPSATPKCVARLNGYSLAYSKRGEDGSAKCGILKRDDASAYVYGVLFAIVNFEREKLDKAEGMNEGYAATTVNAQTMDGPIEALTYVVQKNYVDVTLKPYEWYREHVLRGAREHGLPTDYVARRLDVDAIADPDRQRHLRHMALYDDVAATGA